MSKKIKKERIVELRALVEAMEAWEPKSEDIREIGYMRGVVSRATNLIELYEVEVAPKKRK